MNKNQAKTISINVGKKNFPLFGLLTIIFVVAKIMGYINWSWWLVFLPLWGPLLLVFGFMLFYLMIMFGVILLSSR